jgi:hypothetical protein
VNDTLQWGRRHLLFQCGTCTAEHSRTVRIVVDVPADGTCILVARCPVCAFLGVSTPMHCIGHVNADAPIDLAGDVMEAG